MKKLIAVMLFALIYNGAMAQEKFLPGYVKTAEGVRTDGLIDYRNWDNNPKKVTFKQGEQGKAQVFEALDIAEFGVKDEIYVGAIVDKEITTNVTYGLSKSPDVEVRIDTVFLQTLVSGEKTLLGMKAAGKQNFYIKDGGNYVLLQYKWYMTEKNGAQMRAENTMFRRQLATYLGECLHIIDPLQSATYTSKSLESIFLRYYACTDKMPGFMNVREKVISELGVLGGASSTHLTFESAMAIQDIVNYKFPSSTGVVGGLFLDIVFPRNNRKWSFYNELFYSSYSVRGSFQEIRDENDYRNVEGNLGYTYLKVNNMVRYRYPVAGFKIFVNAGMSNGFALSETNKKSTFTKFYSTETNQEGKVLAETRSYEQGLLLGVGAMAGRITGEFRYERANGMSVYPLLSSRVERYFLLVSYRLK